MSKTSWLIRFSFTVLLIAGCIPLSISRESTQTPTVCEGRDLQQASQSIKMTFNNGKLEELSLGSELYGGRLAVSHDGSKLAIPIYHGSVWTPDGVYVIDIINGKLVCILPIKNNSAIFEGIAFSPNNKLSASLYLDGTIIVRDSNTGETIRELKSIKYDSPGWISFNSDGSRIVTSGYQQPARVWETETGQLITSVDSARVALSPDGNSIAIPDSEGIKITDIATQKVQTIIDYGGQAKVHFIFSPDGNYLYLLNSFSEVTIWNTQNGELISTLNPSTNYDEFDWEKEIRLSLSTDGARLLMENPTKIIVWDTKSWQELVNGRSADMDENIPIVDAVVAPSGEIAIVNYAYNIIRFWKLSQ
jgi:WD40 repeat protein